MAINDLDLNIDLATGRLIRDFLSDVVAAQPEFYRGDKVQCRVRVMKPNRGNPDQPWTEVDISGLTTKVGIGAGTATATATSFADYGTPAITVTELVTGDASTAEIQRIDLSDPEPYGGAYTLTFGTTTTGLLDWDSTAAEIDTALSAIDSAIAVTGGFPIYNVAWGTNGAQSAITGEAGGLLVATGREGELDLDVAGITTLLDGGSSISTTLEVQLTTGTADVTIHQSTVTLYEDIIN